MSIRQDLKRTVAPCTLGIIAVNIIVFIIQNILDSKYDGIVTTGFSLAWWEILDGSQYYRLFTYMFLHGDLSHIFNNMLVFAFLGTTVERLLGKGKFLLSYLGSGVVAGLASVLYSKWEVSGLAESILEGVPYKYSLGASGAVFGMTGILIYIVLVNKGNIAGISMQRLILFAALSIYEGLISGGIDNAAHIGGALFGFIGAICLYERKSGGYGFGR